MPAPQGGAVYRTVLNHMAERERVRLDPKLLGTRASVTGFSFPRDMASALAKDLRSAGVDRGRSSTGARLQFQGGYSPVPRRWDMVIFEEERPIVVADIKSMTGGAFGNNLINRIFDDEARRPFRPCVSFLFVVQRTRESDALSVLDRVAEALTTMRADGLIDAAWLLAVSTDPAQVQEPVPALSFTSFVADVSAHLDSMDALRAGAPATIAAFGRAMSESGDAENVMSGFASTPEGLRAAEVAVVGERRRKVAELQRLAIDEAATETDMHHAIGAHYWLFGGQYVNVLSRRSLLPLDQYDIPLVCADGSLEIVELKGPEANLVTRHRNHFIVSNDVHAAVGQCLNYLRTVDELGATARTHYRDELDIDVDFRRARGTVVIGHPNRLSSPDGPRREQIDQTLRSYNAHLSRLRVLTYADLLDSAERSLRFASEGAISRGSGR